MAKEIPVKPASELIKLPTTEKSHPFGGAKWQVKPIDLDALGYVEEEYLIHGDAKMYSWPEGQRLPDVKLEGPYTNRFLLRKPADPAKFSGNVIIEMNNWARGYDRPITIWGNCWEQVIKNGDAWVGVSVRSDVLANLKKFDPERYGRLSFETPVPKEHRLDVPQSNTYHSTSTDPDSENGLAFDYFSQVALAMREQSEGAPMAGYNVKGVFGTGATAGDLATYVAAVDPVSCRPDGGNIFDGFLIFMTGAPGNLNQYEEKLHWMDERCKFYGKVPLIRVYTCKDMTGGGYHPDWAYMQRRNDSNEAGRYYRSYEIAGTGLMLKYTYYNEPCHEDVEKMGLQIKNGRTWQAWTKEELETFEFPTRYALNAALVNLEKWAEEGIIPPVTQPYETVNTYPDTQLAVDELGNVKGGLRLPYLEVPAYHFNMDATATPLEKETLLKLYKDHDDYVNKVTASCERCVKERILLPDDAKAIIEEAKALTFFD